VQVGDVVAERFELRAVAGEGGMGIVFRAHDRATGADVALKAMLRAPSDAFVAELQACTPPLAARGARILGAEARWRAARAHHAHDLERSTLLRQQASSLLRRAGDVRTAAAEEATRGYELVLLGAHEDALQVLTASLAECRRLGLTFSVAGIRHNLGLALLGLGRLDEALAEEQAAVELFALGGNRAMECASRDYTARILLAAGRADDAVREVERGMGLLAEGHPFVLTGLATLADALVVRGATGDAARALACARRSYAALRADPAQFEEPCRPMRVHLDTLRACGLDEEAREAAAEARAWVLARAAQIQSEAHRAAFLRDALDVARLLSG
jgi:tetratricopeptide (TPR) repeat protein